MIKSFDTFVNEMKEETPFHKPMSSGLRKSLDFLNKFSSNEEIVKAIEELGFKRQPIKGNERTCDYSFLDPQGEKMYKSFTSGDVRSYLLHNWQDGEWRTRITRVKLEEKDRLLFILRRALKRSLEGESFTRFMKSGKNVKQFLHDSRGRIASKKFDF